MGRTSFALFFLLAPVWAQAQGTPDFRINTENRADASGTGNQTAEEAEQVPVIGDTVYFKNGRKLAGVQVIVETLASIEVVPAPGIKSLVLPRSIVERVEYDDVTDATGNWLLNDSGDKYDKEVMEGKEISPELYAKITKPLYSETKQFDDMDFKDALTELADRCELTITFGEVLSSLPAEKREWTVEIEPGSSFLHVLQTEFSDSFPEIEWVYQFDKIGVYVRKNAPVN